MPPVSKACAKGRSMSSSRRRINARPRRPFLRRRLAAGHFVSTHEDGLFLGPPGTGKSHLAQAIGRCAIQQRHRVLYREAHVLIEDIADATIDGTGSN
jgi:DNA replication protein DnaC